MNEVFYRLDNAECITVVAKTDDYVMCRSVHYPHSEPFILSHDDLWKECAPIDDVDSGYILFMKEPRNPPRILRFLSNDHIHAVHFGRELMIYRSFGQECPTRDFYLEADFTDYINHVHKSKEVF